MLDYQSLRNLFESKMLCSREYRRGEFHGIGRCENEFDILRRLFEGFEQCVERLFGQHMDFIDDEYLERGAVGFVFGLFDQCTDIVDLATAGGIHFDDIDMAVFIGHTAVFTRFARGRRGAFVTDE
ncbi:hypothetical protein D1872_287050 [compost metagenome]